MLKTHTPGERRSAYHDSSSALLLFETGKYKSTSLCPLNRAENAALGGEPKTATPKAAPRITQPSRFRPFPDRPADKNCTGARGYSDTQCPLPRPSSKSCQEKTV